MRLLNFILATSVVFSVAVNAAEPVMQDRESQPEQNIILLIGDGMGPGHIKAYRKFIDDPDTAQAEKLIFDDYLVGSLNTDSHDSFENITDSAASATAYAAGKKTINGALSVNKNNQPLKTVLEKAKQTGMSTGLVATSEIVHATPAAFASHQINRENKNDIANQYFDNQFNQMPMVDILLGGGVKYFKRTDRDLIKDFKGKGYQILTNRNQLLNSASDKLLGLFAEEGLDKMWDRDLQTPSLAEMTKVAINGLSTNKKGFFLMVEGSQIDWAAHANDIVGVISEMQDFEQAMQVAIDFARKNKNTLVIATADHETGGLSIGSKHSGDERYFWDLSVIKSFKYTPAKIATDAQRSGSLVDAFNLASSLKLTPKEKKKLAKIDLSDWDEIREKVSKIISKRSYTGWTTEGHTGADVYLYAYGPGSENLRGYWENTKIGQYIFNLIDQ